MKLNRTGSNWNELERSKINENWRIIEGNYNDVVDKVSEEAFDKVVNSAKLNWKEPVDKYADLPSDASEGDTRMVRDSGKVYRFNDEVWQEIQQIDAGPVNELDARLTAQLAQTEKKIAEIEITPMMFGAKGDGATDDRQALINTFRHAMDNGYTVNLLEGRNYLIDSKNLLLTEPNLNIFDIDAPLKIKGKSRFILGEIGDYEAVFRLREGASRSKFYDFEIDENTRNNPITDYEIDHQVHGKRRIAIYGWNSSDIRDLEFDGIRFTDCIGVWQLQVRANDVIVRNSVVDYANVQGVSYDRTCMWARGNNWLVEDNELKGNTTGRTAFELIGDNIRLQGNDTRGFNSMFYITNTLDSKRIDVVNNYFECRMGMEFWFQSDGGVIENINILNNTLKVTGDDPVVMTTGWNTGTDVLIKNIVMELNTFELNSETEPFIWMHNAMNEEIPNDGVHYELFVMRNNIFKGTCKHIMHFGTQPNKRMQFDRMIFEDNKFFVDKIVDNFLINAVDYNGGFKDVMIKNNEFHIKTSASTSPVFRVFNGQSPRYTDIGAFMLKDNIYELPKDFKFSITNLYGQLFCRFEGMVDYELLNETLYIHGTTSYPPQSGYIEDKKGQRITFKDGEIVNRQFKTTEVPTYGPFLRGDYVEKTNPTIINSDGIKYVVKGWLRVTTTSSGAHVLGVDWVEDKVTI